MSRPCDRPGAGFCYKCSVRYVSTRGAAPPVGASEAILQGLAPDGGLYVPRPFPTLDPAALKGGKSFAGIAAEFLSPFVAGDPLSETLDTIVRESFDFPLPLVDLEPGTALLELFHGPTAAFKDVGARFLAASFERILARERPERRKRLTVLVATSGDTGAAVAAACHRRQGIEVGVLFPDGGVSPRQEHQLTCWDDNVRSFAVRGTFDDCQALVKEAFTSSAWRGRGYLSSANSINVGRLLPQAAYYAAASVWYHERHAATPGFVIPSGNVGNAIGCFWAKRCGYPIGEIVMATNANRVVPDWFETGAWRPRPSCPTLANAMDVGNPSNMERLFDLYPDREELLEIARSFSVDDDSIRRTIADAPGRWGQIPCPHTATAFHVRERLQTPHWIVVATAHPAKFEAIVEPLVGHPVEVPASLGALLARPTRTRCIEPRLAEVERCWES